ncbi:MAG: alcohol dehydrogenase catalytic domain-containing protein [Chloroflexota bacterium]|nr:alcohol dehydrogenase catalytic domain-containing protein [Chloroflexota bacterium]
MKALVKATEAVGYEYKDVDMPKVGPKDVLVKIMGTAICGSDIHIYHSSPNIMKMMQLPIVTGHETCGEVIEVGECVTNIKKGDLVSPEPHIFCGECYYCQNDAALNCLNMGLLGHTLNGAFAEYMTVPAQVCWKHPPGTSYELGAIHEPLGVGMHGVMAGEINGKSVAVFGCGPIGMFALGASRVFGATKIFGIEVAPKRIAMARQLFPDVTIINSKEQDPVKTIMDATGSLGVDVSIELSGNAEATKLCFQVLKREGRVSLVGVPPGPIEFDFHPNIILKEARVFGVFGRVVWQTWWQVRAMLDTGRFDPLPIITHRFPLADYEKAFELAQSGEAGKILLLP